MSLTCYTTARWLSDFIELKTNTRSSELGTTKFQPVRYDADPFGGAKVPCPSTSTRNQASCGSSWYGELCKLTLNWKKISTLNHVN